MIEITKKLYQFAHNLSDGVTTFKHDLIGRAIDAYGKVGLAGGGSAVVAEKVGWITLDGSEWVLIISGAGGLTLIIDRMIRLFFFIKRERREEQHGRDNNY